LSAENAGLGDEARALVPQGRCCRRTSTTGAEGFSRLEPWFARFSDGVRITEAAREHRARIVEAGWESAALLEQLRWRG
jgi:hypothetical protein